MSVNLASLLDFLGNDLSADTDDIDADTALFSTGTLDSFAIVSLLMFLEAEGRVRILPSDVTLENFDTLASIIRFVELAHADLRNDSQE